MTDPLDTLARQQNRQAIRARGTATLTGMAFLVAIAAALCALRFLGVIAWPWWLCLAPVIALAADVILTTAWHRINRRR